MWSDFTFTNAWEWSDFYFSIYTLWYNVTFDMYCVHVFLRGCLGIDLAMQDDNNKQTNNNKQNKIMSGSNILSTHVACGWFLSFLHISHLLHLVELSVCLKKKKKNLERTQKIMSSGNKATPGMNLSFNLNLWDYGDVWHRRIQCCQRGGWCVIKLQRHHLFRADSIVVLLVWPKAGRIKS